MQSFLKSAAVPAAALCAVVGGWFVGQMMPADGPPVSEQLQRYSAPQDGVPALAGGHVMTPARSVDSFSLVKHDSTGFTEADLAGQWTFFFMGYTHCPDICPITMTELDHVHRELAPVDTDPTPVKTVFVSVDPRRDTPDRLKEYTGYFNPDISGVTGESSRLEEFAKAMRLVYLPAPDEPIDSNYLVDHSAQVILVNPKGELQAIFSAPQRGTVMLEDFKQIRSWYAENTG